MKVKKLAVYGLAALTTIALASCNSGTEATSGTNANPSSVATPSSEATPSSTVDPNAKKAFTAENYANGAYSYVASSYEDRTDILGLLESYAVKHNLTGLTLYGSGRYVMYDPAIQKGSNTYIPGYGFGILSEGKITADLEKEDNAAWKRYYHVIDTDDPGTMNYMNSKGSSVGTYNGYSGAGYWTTQINETGDGYEWVGEAAKEKPVALNANENGLATRYRFEVKVGSEMKYNTLSTNPTFAKYNGREVALEDYLTSYKILWTKKFAMVRMADNLNGAGSIKGSSTYVQNSAEGLNETEFAKTGVKAYQENGKSYLEFEFNIPCNSFYAMYYLSSSMHAPIPMSYIEDLGNGDLEQGVKAFGCKTDAGLTPVDTFLTTGAYTPEVWDATQIVFKKNPYYDLLASNEDRYQIAGIHTRIYPAAKSAKDAAIKYFLSGYTHSASIPDTYLEQYVEDPRTTQTGDTSTYKLNLNTCTQEMWEKLFGVNGTVKKNATTDYYQCKPIMSNQNFISGLSYALNREAFAKQFGVTATANYFASAYLSNPEEGISYNSTKQHLDAVEKLQEGTKYGYNIEYARAAFKKACDELIAAGSYKEGDEVTIDCYWMEQVDCDDYGSRIKAYWEEAFNSCGGGLTLKIANHVAGSDYTAVYYLMMDGKYDVGFGSISGNSLNPINFLEVLKSDNSSGFTLNWGTDTSVVSEDLYFDGAYWSFDGLWKAADQGGYFKDGNASEAFAITKTKLDEADVVKNADGTVTVTIQVEFNEIPDKISIELFDAVIFGYFDVAGNPTYGEESIGETEFVLSDDGKSVVCTISADLVAKYGACLKTKNFGIDLYAALNILGIDSTACKTAYFTLPE